MCVCVCVHKKIIAPCKKYRLYGMCMHVCVLFEFTWPLHLTYMYMYLYFSAPSLSLHSSFPPFRPSLPPSLPQRFRSAVNLLQRIEPQHARVSLIVSLHSDEQGYSLMLCPGRSQGLNAACISCTIYACIYTYNYVCICTLVHCNYVYT